MGYRIRSVLFLLVAVVLTASIAQARSITRIEENDPSIIYSGGWYTNNSGGNSGGSAALTNSTGARAVVTFIGSAISWLGVADRWNGLATITLDGQPQKVDGWADSTHYQAVLFSVSGLIPGPHKLSIEINHERGPNGEGSWVWLDAFDVQDGGGMAGGIPAATAGRVENSDPALTYTGIWYTNGHAMHSGGSAVLAVGAGSSVTLDFVGTSVSWIAYRDEWSGLARVFVDGELKTTMDTYLSPARAQATPYSIDGLELRNHSITIEITGTRNESSQGAWIWLDAFDIGQ